MKPDPHLLTQAITGLNTDPAATVLIGDSTTDIDAAHACGIRVIGYVNKPGKDQKLAQAHALTTRMSELAYLAGQPPAITKTVSSTRPRH